MQFNILITGGLYADQAAHSALRFCRAAVAAGHIIDQVFFYQGAVGVANKLATPLSDEFDATTEWAQFSIDSGAPLVVCISAAERRGVLGQEQAEDQGKPHSNLHSQYQIAGLGMLHEASLTSDRTVTFR